MASKSSFTLEFLADRVTSADDPSTVTHKVVGNDAVHAFGFKRRDFDEYRLGNLIISQVDYKGNDLFGAYKQDHFPFNWLIREGTVRAIIGGGDLSEPTETEVDGETVFKSTSNSVKSDSSILRDRYDADRIPKFKATLLVRPDATIKNLDARTTVVQDSNLTEFRFGVGTKAFGKTEVTEPGWKSQAQSKAPDISPRVQNDHIVLSHTGGQTLPRESQIQVFTDGGYNGNLQFNSSLAEGGEVWLWHEGSDLHLSHGEPTTSSPNPFAPEDKINIRLFPINLWIRHVQNF
jgi:hypothetical protein